MSILKLPCELTGLFFVLDYDNDLEEFTIFFDDDDQSSFILGSVKKSMHQFKLWSHESNKPQKLLEASNRAIDMAREFGASLAIFTENPVRVSAIYDKSVTRVITQEALDSEN